MCLVTFMAKGFILGRLIFQQDSPLRVTKELQTLHRAGGRDLLAMVHAQKKLSSGGCCPVCTASLPTHHSSVAEHLPQYFVPPVLLPCPPLLCTWVC